MHAFPDALHIQPACFLRCVWVWLQALRIRSCSLWWSGAARYRPLGKISGLPQAPMQAVRMSSPISTGVFHKLGMEAHYSRSMPLVPSGVLQTVPLQGRKLIKAKPGIQPPHPCNVVASI